VEVPLAVGTGLLLMGAVVWVVCAIAAYQRAPLLGRRAWVWGVVTLIGGPIALFIMYLLPRPKHQSQAGHHTNPAHHTDPAQPTDPHHDAPPHHHNQHKHHDQHKSGH
jgi:ABC-type nickel/cobalt efflux system permease component RcnA